MGMTTLSSYCVRTGYRPGGATKGFAVCLFLGVLGALVLLPQPVVATVWPMIRDGVVHIEVPEHSETPVAVAWKDAWISESQTDHVYLQNPDGSLHSMLQLTADNTPGEKVFELTQPGIFRLEVAGSSFRHLTVTIPDGIRSMFEPVKVHHSVELPRGGQLYFNIPADKEFTFGAKHYSGVADYVLSKGEEKDSFSVHCPKHELYPQFERKSFVAAPAAAFWQLRWRGTGKAAFWLDDVPNLFAQRPEDLFTPVLAEAHSSMSMGCRTVGVTPALGVAFPFVAPPADGVPIISTWGLGAAGHYVFVDYYQDLPGKFVDFKAEYEKTFGIAFNNAIFALSGRRPVFPSAKGILPIMESYLQKRTRLDGHRTYYAIGDEPNLNYPSYERYERQFAEIAAAIKSSSDPLVSSTLLATPQSSRFLNGPTRPGALQRKGIDWAERLISRYGKYIDAISWHEWLVRDLIDTSRFREAVESAAALAAKYRQELGKEPALIIGQTNISSGHSLSTYENDTFFAAMWWASVVIEASSPGKLQQLIWFKVADDTIYKKGMLAVRQEKLVEKPVAGAMSFINSNLGHSVLPVVHEHPELDVLATLSQDENQLIILGVNKAARAHRLEVALPSSCAELTLSTLTSSGIKDEELAAPKSSTAILPLAGETIFALRCKLAGGQRQGLHRSTGENPTPGKIVQP